MLMKWTVVLLTLFYLSSGFTDKAVANNTFKASKTAADTGTFLPTLLFKNNTFSYRTNTQQKTTAEVSYSSILKSTPAVPSHSAWNKLLAKHVNAAGDVVYKNFLADKSQLQNYLDYLAKNSVKKEWSKHEKLAYYINLYNAATVMLILNNYPTKSIKDIKNPWGKAWVKTGDGMISLGDIEHKILRKMNEPRIHFAINCASYSCPKLSNKAFTAAQMENQLEQAAIDFINDTSRNKISAQKLQLSNIFKWYKKDFTINSTLASYINTYTNIEINDKPDIDYLKYNWQLNEAK